MTAIRLEGAGGIELEARWDRPAEPAGVAVFCHPNPRQQGTMTVPLMEKVTASLVEHGLAVLRFNFRGVGTSTGEWDRGHGEVDDVATAVAAATETHRDLPLGIGGWSFGAVMSLKWTAREQSPVPYAGIAPPVGRFGSARVPRPEELPPAKRTFIIGDRDQFATVAEMQSYADLAGATVRVLEGSDHFFYFREPQVAEMVTEAICPYCPHPGDR